jgi:PIN domain nuclease of toxin-antitoxin system
MSPEPERSADAWVLDASALFAMLQSEPGGDLVRDLLEVSLMSTVNWSEVVQKALDRQVETAGLREDLEALGLQIIPFSPEQAERTAHLRAQTRQAGLSLGDRACLALAAERNLPAITADGAWTTAEVAIEIRAIR